MNNIDNKMHCKAWDLDWNFYNIAPKRFIDVTTTRLDWNKKSFFEKFEKTKLIYSIR